ncbi:MAG: SOS response-associated peptidase [Clostridia bacterium]|nr:SOS response-associated peptidase [Clostridia bacterium]
MCGRFYVPEKDIDDFAGLVNLIEKELLKKAGEFCPGDYSPVITPKPNYEPIHTSDDAHDVHLVKWGFPSGTGKPIINARSETIHEKPLFKLPLATKRCLVPARGFFEWKDSETDKKRIKHYISYFDASMMYLAGLYWFFKDKNGVNCPYFTIITTEANEEISKIHHRMPVIIQEGDKLKWLYEKQSEKVRELLKPMPSGLLLVETCSK